MPFEESGGRANVAGRRPGAVESRGLDVVRLCLQTWQGILDQQGPVEPLREDLVRQANTLLAQEAAR
ncbi:MAG TPA: hypothetical protein VH257_23230 [Chloroflexota bacterium]|nr:hypothetical protein [Chloroflexota bacterium]